MLQVWRVDGDEWSLVPVPEQKKLFSGDCYIVQYTYPSNGRDENLFYAWLGRDSVPVSTVCPPHNFAVSISKSGYCARHLALVLTRRVTWTDTVCSL